MADQTKLSQAQNSVEKATNAVGQAGDHPSERMISQAENAVAHAEGAVNQAKDASGSSAEQLEDQVQSARSALDGSTQG